MTWRIEEYRTAAGETPVGTLGDGLFELRRNQVRLFYIFEPGQVIRLLGGMVKKRDRIPAEVLVQMRGFQKDAREQLTRKILKG